MYNIKKCNSKSSSKAKGGDSMMKVLVLAIVITIAYLFFSVWNVFVTGRQRKLGVVDYVYIVLFMLFTGLITSMKVIFLLQVLFMMWLFIMIMQVNRNAQMK